MKYYYLQRGDYLQLGDEYIDIKGKKWRKISDEYLGKKYGVNEQGEPSAWVRVRRLVPDDFELRKQPIDVPIQEQWGEEL